jgi:hypothetical protein
LSYIGGKLWHSFSAVDEPRICVHKDVQDRHAVFFKTGHKKQVLSYTLKLCRHVRRLGLPVGTLLSQLTPEVIYLSCQICMHVVDQCMQIVFQE